MYLDLGPATPTLDPMKSRLWPPVPIATPGALNWQISVMAGNRHEVPNARPADHARRRYLRCGSVRRRWLSFEAERIRDLQRHPDREPDAYFAPGVRRG